MKSKNHNCRQCKSEWLGRCMNSVYYGRDVSMAEEICPMFIDGRAPENITFDTVGQLENYLRESFYTMDFCSTFTRPQLKSMLELLYQHTVKQNPSGRAFSHMCKTRMVKHIEFYIKLHNLKSNHRVNWRIENENTENRF